MLALLGMGDDHHVLAGGDDCIAGREEAAPLFGEVGIAFAVAEGLDAGLLVLLADMGNTELFSPIRRIDYQRLADIRRDGDLVHDGDELVPRLGFLHAADVHLGGAAFGVDEERIRKPAGEGALPDAFAAVHDRLDGAVDFAGRNLKHCVSPYFRLVE